MRKLLLATTACFLLTGGMALANEYGGKGGSTTTTTTTTIPVVKNAVSLGKGNSSATTGGTAVSESLKDVGNTTTKTSVDDSFNQSTKNLSNVDNKTLTSTRTDTRIDVKLATSSNDGSVGGTLYINDPNCGCEDRSKGSYGALTGNAEMKNVNGGQGILTAQQNTGVNALQQSSVALGSVVSGSSNSGVGGL